MTLAKYLLLTVVCSGSLFAQQLNRSLVASRDDIPTTPRPFIVTADTVRVLAVLVQFQIDTDNRTTGNGQFDLSTPATPRLDSPPRNRQYFLDHLTFLENYYRKASKGKLVVRTTLVDSVYTLRSQMEQYSPRRNETNYRVGHLARETWAKVDSSGRIPDFSIYDCFIVFHAGAGRDIDLVGTLGYDPTPFDIPSLYLGLNALRVFFGQDYNGIPVRNGFHITNTIVMPETESREIPATPTNVQLVLGINGLLVASVGNYLGLPDLFDTNTGRSGIGRFGLMDGQAIFSFAGAFPPEPSAWEKHWLGWIQPVTLGAGEHTVSLPAVSLSDTVYKIPIGGPEYFLVENRSRDAARDGQRVTTRYAGTIRQQTFGKDTTGFSAFDVAALAGNVIDVDDLDWSLPGGVSRDGEFFDGGTLIWHIDESIIVHNLGPNTVNAFPERRGVDLEEADGSQDIGQQYGQFDPGSGSEEGTALDFWFQGNASPVNRNEFSASTFPNSGSNTGAKSHVTIKDFSRRSPRMTAKVIIGGDVAPLAGFPKLLSNMPAAKSLTVADIQGEPVVFVASQSRAAERPVPPAPVASNVSAFKVDGSGLLRTDGRFTQLEIPGEEYTGPVAVADINNDGSPEIISSAWSNAQAQQLGRVQALRIQRRSVDSLAVPLFSTQLARNANTTPTIAGVSTFVGGVDGRFYQLGANGSVLDSTMRLGNNEAYAGISLRPDGRGLAVATTWGTVGLVPFDISSPPVVKRLADGSTGDGFAMPPVVGMWNGEERIVVGMINGTIHMLNSSLAPVPGFPVKVKGEFGAGLTLGLADIDGDGSRDIIAFSGNKIYALNAAGASLDNFPKQIPSARGIVSNPVVADVDGDGNVDIVAVTQDGLVVAYDRTGKMTRGFPLQAGIGYQSVAALTIPNSTRATIDIGLAVVSSVDGSVSAWRTGTASSLQAVKMPWPQYQRDAQHSGLAAEAIPGSPLSSEFFPKDRAYNWPNPVYDGRTFIRYYLKENATVRIKILDLAGDLVTEFAGPGVGGVDNEIEWSVGNVQSGVYLARVEASGVGGGGVAVIKVAVVK